MLTFRDVLDDGGLIARRREGYERREAQLAMAAEVDAAIRAKRCLAVEAGTGVGKSFAYLVPAILYVAEEQAREISLEDLGVESRANQESTLGDRSLGDVSSSQSVMNSDSSSLESASVDSRLTSSKIEAPSFPDEPFMRLINDGTKDVRRVVVSTHTISLQEQLFEKDIPFLNAILPVEFTAALAKGRSNYVCLRRFVHAQKNDSTNKTLFEDERKLEFKRLTEWVANTVDGSKSELPQAPSPDVWEEICCEQGNCLGRKCPWREKCFYIRARKVLASADLIVVNHALLFSDLAIRREGGAILPEYDVLIFDEAHTMEEVASEHIGVELSQYAVDYVLSRLYNARTNRGLLVEEASQFKIDVPRKIFDEAEKLVEDCRLRAIHFFEDLENWLDERPNSNGRVFEKNIVEAGICEGLLHLCQKLREAADFIEDPSRRQEYISARERIESLVVSVNDWLEQRGVGFVYWIERVGGGLGKRAKLSIVSAPIDVAPILRSQLFNVIPTVIATSATLTTGGFGVRANGLRGLRKKTIATNPESTIVDAIAVAPDHESEETRKAFAFFRNRIGLNGAPARALGSPYNYREQMTLVLAKGLEITESEAFRQGLDRDELRLLNESRLFMALQDYISETDGGVFVLFTNASQMRAATDRLGTWLASNNYPFYSQSEGASRQLMVKRFKESNRSVLFGVDSFWQGVDVPGAALRNVIIVKFPFQAPEKPLVEARLKKIDDAGGNSFLEYSLPNAILKFKQGVGRLIRTREDFGQVVVLDERIHTKFYGKNFLRALPDCKLRVDTFKGLD